MNRISALIRSFLTHIGWFEILLIGVCILGLGVFIWIIVKVISVIYKRRKHQKDYKLVNNQEGMDFQILRKTAQHTDKDKKQENEIIPITTEDRSAKLFDVKLSSDSNIIPANAQNIGSRENQQDAFGFSFLEDKELVNRKGVMIVLADGMGGMALGQDASNLAVREIIKAYMKELVDETITEQLNAAIRRANSAVLTLASEAHLDSRVGTTVVAAVVHQSKLFWISVGDSHIYIYRDKKLLQLSKDHNYAQHLEKQVQQGVLSFEEADHHPEKMYLTSYLGIDPLEEIDQNLEPLMLQSGDCILLCSDGLYGTLPEIEIEEIIGQYHENACEILVQQTLLKNKKYQDNVTVATLYCI